MATIEIPDDMIPESYELTGEYRRAEVGEYWLDGYGINTQVTSTTQGVYPILRKKLALPTLVKLKPGWVAKDRTGTWYWYSTKPTCNKGIWEGAGCIPLKSLDAEWPDVKPEDSLIKV